MEPLKRSAVVYWKADPFVLGALALLICCSACQLTDHTEKDPNAITVENLNIPASGTASVSEALNGNAAPATPVELMEFSIQ